MADRSKPDAATLSTGSFAPRISFWDYVKVLRRQWRWFVAIAILVPALGYAFATLQPIRYQADAQVLITPSAAQEAINQSTGNAAASTRTLTNEINLALGAEVRGEVESRFGPVDVDNDVLITAEPGADVLVFTATQATADDAADLANIWAQSYVRVKQENAAESIGSAIDDLNTRLIDLTTERAAIRQPLTDLERQIATAETGQESAALESEAAIQLATLSPQLGLIDAQINGVATTVAELELSGQLAGSGSAQLLEPAAPPIDPTNPSLPVVMILSGLVAVLLGFAASVLADRIDRTIRSVADVETLGLSVIGTVPMIKDRGRRQIALSTVDAPESHVANAYQKIRTSLQFALMNADRMTLTITSANAGEGKTSTSANVAIGLAQAGKRVTLIDGDMRRPQLDGLFGLPMTPGLSECVTTSVRPKHAVSRFVVNETSDLRVLTAGGATERPADLIVSEAFEKTLNEIQNDSDIVVIDSPPVLPVVDAAALAQHSDVVVLVSRIKTTKTNELVQASEEVERAGAKVLGVILIGRDDRTSSYGTYY